MQRAKGVTSEQGVVFNSGEVTGQVSILEATGQQQFIPNRQVRPTSNLPEMYDRHAGK